MSVQHSAITDPNLHEPKGVAAAAIDQVYIANGAGSGAWAKVGNTSLEGISSDISSGHFLLADGAGGFASAPAAHGSTYFSNFGAAYVLAATTSYAKVAATTTAGGEAIAMTEGTNSRLTYTGTNAVHMDIVYGVTFDQATGADKDIYLALYKNGVLVPGSEAAVTTVSGKKALCSIHRDVHMSLNDYVEIYCKISAAANVNFYTINLQAGTIGA